VKLSDIGTGVTNPKRAELAPGGLIGAMAWKPIRPGRYGGFWESYKSEIAAYELDKLLDLGMVPPKVERRIDGEVGVAVMWIDGARSFADMGGAPKPPPQKVAICWKTRSRSSSVKGWISSLQTTFPQRMPVSRWTITAL
jgi:hypothetical protein